MRSLESATMSIISPKGGRMEVKKIRLTYGTEETDKEWVEFVKLCQDIIGKCGDGYGCKELVEVDLTMAQANLLHKFSKNAGYVNYARTNKHHRYGKR